MAYIVFHDRVREDSPTIVKFDDLAKIEFHYERLDARHRNSRTATIIASIGGGDSWYVVPEGSDTGHHYRKFWVGNNTEVYAALEAIASGLHTAEECSAIAQAALDGVPIGKALR